MTKDVDFYFSEGCGRCPLGGTPQCKVHNWPKELQQLRSIALDCGLTEEVKWGVPCYTHKNNNVAIVSAFKDYASLSFFKGSLLRDEHKLLEKPGENTQSARLIKFTNVKDIVALRDILKAYLFEAIENEEAGKKVTFKDDIGSIPEELEVMFKKHSDLKKAFYDLSPGRQRGYILHFSQARQAKTRIARIENYIEHILKGKGFHDK